MLLHHRHLVVYCGLSIVSPLVLCYLPCNILINIIARLFRFRHRHLVYCGLDIVSPLVLFPSVQHADQCYYGTISVPSPRHLVYCGFIVSVTVGSVPLCLHFFAYHFGSFPFVIALLLLCLVPPSASCCLLWIRFTCHHG